MFNKHLNFTSIVDNEKFFYKFGEERIDEKVKTQDNRIKH